MPMQAPDRRIFLFGYGRTALDYGLRSLALPPGSGVLIPAYVTGSAVGPILRCGLTPQFYDLVPETLNPDWSRLATAVNNATRVLVVVHYFGFPADIPGALDFCRQHALFLVEDSAHSYLSQFEGQNLGTYGDLGVFSLRKVLPIPNGGMLVIKKDLAGGIPEAAAGLPGEPDTTRLLALLGRYMEEKAGRPLPRPRRLSPAVGHLATGREYATGFTADYAASAWSRRILRVIDGEAVIACRRTNYEFLANRSLSPTVGVLLRPSLPPGVCPQALPLLVDNRDRLVARLRDSGVDAWGWPSVPAEVDLARYPGADYLARRMLLLPIHQGLSSKATQYLATVLSGLS